MRTGIIYKIVDNTNLNCYYGATIQKISARKGGHKRDYKRYCAGGYNNKPASSFSYTACEIFKNNDYTFEIMEQMETDLSKSNLLEREKYYIQNFPCVNKIGKS